MLDQMRQMFSSTDSDAELQQRLAVLRKRLPVPVFWLLGKTQSGKTSLIKYLTGAEEAEIGSGFRPCTRTSREYLFPMAEAPLLTFVDTRGLDEPGYDPAEDLARFNAAAHVVLVTVKALDHAQENVLRVLREVRRARPARPVVLVLTCLHEAYPQQQHPTPYPFGTDRETTEVPADLARSLAEQRRRFEGLVDRVVPVDLTKPEEGFNEADYGGAALEAVLVDVLPEAYAQTLRSLTAVTGELKDLYAKAAMPRILAYSTLAATAGAIPIPWLDLLVLPGIQARLVYSLAELYGQPLTGRRFLELASTLGLGIVMRQAAREVVKFIPWVGSVAGGALAGTSTFALGRAFCYYYSAIHQGHTPRPEELKNYYREQLALAETTWRGLRQK